MKKFTLIVLVILSSVRTIYSQANLLIKAPPGNNASTTSRAPNGNVSHTTMRGCFFVSPNELTPYFVPGTSISSFGFSLTAGVTGSGTTGNFTVYLQNTSDLSYLKGTSFTTAITPMTTAYASTMTVPVSAGTTSVILTLSTPFTYTGGGLYVAYDWASAGPFSAGTATYVADNSIGASGASNSTSVTTAIDNMGISSFRPVFLFGAVNSATNDAQVQAVEALGSVPAIFNIGHLIKAVIKNGSNMTLNNIPVNLNVGGANTFADTQTLTTLASGATTTVVFSPFNPQTNGVNTISVSVPTDQLPANNLKSYSQTVTCNVQGQNPQPAAYSVGVGYQSNSGIIAATLITPVTATCIGSRIGISGDAGTPNNSIYSVLMDQTGNIIATSNTLLVTGPMLNTFQSFTFAIPQTLNAGTTYYIGLAQPANTVTPYWPLASSPSPYIPANFYVTSILGGGFVSTLAQNLGYFGLEAKFAHTSTTGATASPSVSCSGSPVTLAASGGSVYLWSTGAGTSSVVVTPTTSLTYSVAGTNSIGCKSNATVAVNVLPTPTVTASTSNSIICSGNTTSLSAGGTADTYSWSTSATASVIAINPTVTATYSVMGTSTTTGCSSTATVDIIVNTPTIAIASPSAICNGSAASLFASGANTYTWNTGSTSSGLAVTPSVTTNYSVTGTNTTGCTGAQTVQVMVNPTPTVMASALPTTSVCSGNSFTLSVNGAANYSVYSNPGVSSINSPSVTPYSVVYTPTVTDTYTVLGTYTNNCANTKTITVSVLSCVGLNELNPSEANISIYPNPSTGIFKLGGEGFAVNSSVEIYNVLGVLVKHQSVVSEVTTINIQNEANGVYFIKLLENGKVTKTSRIVKH